MYVTFLEDEGWRSMDRKMLVCTYGILITGVANFVIFSSEVTLRFIATGIIIIIITGQTALSWAIAVLRKFWPNASGFHFYGFRNKFILRSRIVSLASNPQSGGLDPLYLRPQWQGGPLIPPRHQVHVSSFSKTRQAYGGSILIRLHMGELKV
jgi:hypothetical protein